MASLFHYLAKHSFISFLCHLVGKLMPATNRTNKIKNIFYAISSINKKHTVALNLPVKIRIAPISICNYKCLFCEIHKDNLLYPDRSHNVFNMDDLKRYEHMLSKTYSISFYGGSEEPLLNKHFGEFVSYLKSKYKIRMMVNTNASVLTSKLSDILVEKGFDRILVSYHAGTKDSYKYLMTGNIETVDRNISYLTDQKKIRRKKKPEIDFNFALHKLNAPEYRKILDKAKDLGINKVIVNRYYGGRNKLQDSHVSFEHDIDLGNQILDKIYSYAGDIKIRLTPGKPQHWTAATGNINWDDESYDRQKQCFEPWLSLHFNPVLNDNDCHYVGVCNRIELFKVNYRTADLGKNNFDRLWNHPVLQYIRETVNSKNINPICKFCKNHSLAALRNVDEDRYAHIRDNAVKALFDEFNMKYDYSPVEGIELLKEHHCPDAGYIEIVSDQKTGNSVG